MTIQTPGAGTFFEFIWSRLEAVFRELIVLEVVRRSFNCSMRKAKLPAHMWVGWPCWGCSGVDLNLEGIQWITIGAIYFSYVKYILSCILSNALFVQKLDKRLPVYMLVSITSEVFPDNRPRFWLPVVKTVIARVGCEPRCAGSIPYLAIVPMAP